MRVPPAAAAGGERGGHERRRAQPRPRLGVRGHEPRPAALDQARIEAAGGELPVVQQAPQEAEIGSHAEHGGAAQRLAEGEAGALAVGRMGDDLGDHRIVVEGDDVALADAAVDPEARFAVRQLEAQQPAGRGQETASGILGVEARLDGVAGEADVVLAPRQPLAGGDPQLPFHEVEARDRLGDRVLDLQARVHLHEVERAVGVLRVEEELDGAGIDIADRPRRLHRNLGQAAARGRRQPGGGRFLDDLLVAPLHRALAFEHVDDATMGVGEDLHLDVARPRDAFLDQHPARAEGAPALTPRRRQRRREIPRPVDPAHALAAAAGGGLDHHRVAEGPGAARQRRGALVAAVVAGHDRHAGLGHHRLGTVLGAHPLDRRGRRSDEDQAGPPAGGGEDRVLGEKSVARMDRLGAASPRSVDDAVVAQIAVARRRRADRTGLAGDGGVARAAIGPRIDRHGGYAKAVRGLDDAAGNLAAVGNEDFVEHGGGR